MTLLSQRLGGCIPQAGGDDGDGESRRADRGAAGGATPRMDPALREARTRYDHPTGWLGVDIADALVARWLITPGDEAGTVATPHGGARSVVIRKLRDMIMRPDLSGCTD